MGSGLCPRRFHPLQPTPAASRDFQRRIGFPGMKKPQSGESWVLSRPRKGSPGEQIPGILAVWPSPGGVGRTPWGGREARVGRWKLDLFPETWQDKEKKLKKISFWTRFPSVFGVSAPRPQNEAQGRLRKEGSVFKPPKEGIWAESGAATPKSRACRIPNPPFPTRDPTQHRDFQRNPNFLPFGSRYPRQIWGFL